MLALSIKNLVKKYPSPRFGLRRASSEKVAVNGISFAIEEGEFFGFLGPKGAGKTSTINSVVGISKFNEGVIKVFDKDVVADYREARKLIGISSQEYNVDIFASVEKILWYVGGYYGMTSVDRKKRIPELLKLFELYSHKDKQFRMLSGGLKRRLMLARALIHDPKLLILDEPTAGVDVELRHELWNYLKQINEQGKTILLTSHYLEEVERLCGRIAIINKGNIVAIGDKADFVGNGEKLEKRYLELTK